MELKLTPVASLIALTIAGAGPSCGNSPMPFAPNPPCWKGISSKKTWMGGTSSAVGHDVVGHLVVGHVSVLQDDLFIERIADALRDAAFNLSGSEHGIE